jgi:CRISPR/Cas system-associated exonuclease Cas4 (RecB family)
MAKRLFDAKSKEPFEISRTKLELFLSCPRCFYLDRKFGISRPSFPAFTLNSAVDALLKKEFDIHRSKKEAHPLMKNYGIDLIPFQHEKMEEWRHNFTGVRYLHRATNFLVFGAIDDLWVDKDGTLFVVDYKSTSSDYEVNLDGEYKMAYKRQVEIYQWLLRKNGFKVSDIAYFVYANGRKDLKAFDARLEFNISVLAYSGNSDWVEQVVIDAKHCLEQPNIPEAEYECEYCNYRKAAGLQENKKVVKSLRKTTGNSLF